MYLDILTDSFVQTDGKGWDLFQKSRESSSALTYAAIPDALVFDGFWYVWIFVNVKYMMGSFEWIIEVPFPLVGVRCIYFQWCFFLISNVGFYRDILRSSLIAISVFYGYATETAGLLGSIGRISVAMSVLNELKRRNSSRYFATLVGLWCEGHLHL